MLRTQQRNHIRKVRRRVRNRIERRIERRIKVGRVRIERRIGRIKIGIVRIKKLRILLPRKIRTVSKTMMTTTLNNPLCSNKSKTPNPRDFWVN